MADTVLRQTVPTSWAILNTLVSIPVEDEINGQAVQGFGIRLFIGASAPGSNFEGFRFSDGEWFQVSVGSNEAWVIAIEEGDGWPVTEDTIVVAEPVP